MPVQPIDTMSTVTFTRKRDVSVVDNWTSRVDKLNGKQISVYDELAAMEVLGDGIFRYPGNNVTNTINILWKSSPNFLDKLNEAYWQGKTACICSMAKLQHLFNGQTTQVFRGMISKDSIWIFISAGDCYLRYIMLIWIHNNNVDALC